MQISNENGTANNAVPETEEIDPCERGADLADLVLSVARKITATEHEVLGEDAIPLSSLERIVMRFIDRHPETSPSRISAELGMKSANTSAALRSLDKHGLITRSPDPLDARSVLVRPTPLAQLNLRRIRQGWSRLLGPLLPPGCDTNAAIEVLATLDHAFHAGPADRSNLA